MFLGDKRLTAFLEREQPDILVIQEALWWLQERRWERLELPIGELGQKGFPDHVEVGASGSLVVYSNLPFQTKTSRIVRGELHDTASVIHDPDRELLQVSLDTGTTPLKLLAVHPDSPRNLIRWQNKRLYFDEADTVIQDLRKAGNAPLLVIGDWNSAPWSARFQQTLSQNGLKTAYPGDGRAQHGSSSTTGCTGFSALLSISLQFPTTSGFSTSPPVRT
jgi:endonuclease/exonuclease/phosphatase (EEP) superfamily protein YafD